MTKTIYVITWMTKFKNQLNPRYNSDQKRKKDYCLLYKDVEIFQIRHL